MAVQRSAVDTSGCARKRKGVRVAQMGHSSDFFLNNRLGETNETLTMQGQVGQVKGFGLYSKCDRKPVLRF